MKLRKLPAACGTTTNKVIEYECEKGLGQKSRFLTASNEKNGRWFVWGGRGGVAVVKGGNETASMVEMRRKPTIR